MHIAELPTISPQLFYRFLTRWLTICHWAIPLDSHVAPSISICSFFGLAVILSPCCWCKNHQCYEGPLNAQKSADTNILSCFSALSNADESSFQHNLLNLFCALTYSNSILLFENKGENIFQRLLSTRIIQLIFVSNFIYKCWVFKCITYIIILNQSRCK